MALREIEYERNEFHANPQKRRANLLAFIYDIPYFPPCGIFPPLHLLNQVLEKGGGDGGMSPGASWKPFSINDAEYAELIEAIEVTPLESVVSQARYAHLKPRIDRTFDDIQDYTKWMFAVCNKHRDSWHKELNAAGKLS